MEGNRWTGKVGGKQSKVGGNEGKLVKEEAKLVYGRKQVNSRGKMGS